MVYMPKAARLNFPRPLVTEVKGLAVGCWGKDLLTFEDAIRKVPAINE
jgi:hypothetical protein